MIFLQASLAFRKRMRRLAFARLDFLTFMWVATTMASTNPMLRCLPAHLMRLGGALQIVADISKDAKIPTFMIQSRCVMFGSRRMSFIAFFNNGMTVSNLNGVSS